MTQHLDLDALHAELIETLQGIVNANWRNWKELASAEEFERWAKSRANQAIDRLRKAEAVSKWMSVNDRLPEDRESVAFVVDCKASAWNYLNGRVLGGTYVANQGFSIPGLTIGASYWKPLDAAPTSADSEGEKE